MVTIASGANAASAKKSKAAKKATTPKTPKSAKTLKPGRASTARKNHAKRRDAAAAPGSTTSPQPLLYEATAASTRSAPGAGQAAERKPKMAAQLDAALRSQRKVARKVVWTSCAPDQAVDVETTSVEAVAAQRLKAQEDTVADPQDPDVASLLATYKGLIELQQEELVALQAKVEHESQVYQEAVESLRAESKQRVRQQKKLLMSLRSTDQGTFERIARVEDGLVALADIMSATAEAAAAADAAELEKLLRGTQPLDAMPDIQANLPRCCCRCVAGVVKPATDESIEAITPSAATTSTLPPTEQQ